MLAQRKRQDIGCRLSFKTATANSQSRVDAGLSCASLLCAAPAIRPITNAKDVSKSAVGFIELPQTHRTASTFHDCRETIPMGIYWIEAEISGFLSTFRCWRGPSPARGGRDAHLTAGRTPALRRSVRLVGCSSGTAISQTAPPYFSSLSNPAVLV
jgi:hypothetical protein